MSLLHFIVMTSVFLFSANGIALAQPSDNTDLASYDYFDDEDFESYEPINIAEVKDPFEKYNRKIFAFNETFDKYFFEHVARVYHDYLPEPARNIAHNFVTNLFLPVSTVNSILQGKTENSLSSFSHFLINSTVGIGGLFNVARHKGIKYNDEDFGQTLGHYGVGSGFYIMLPVLGPSTIRDFGGTLVDKAVNPLEFNLLQLGHKENFVNPGYLISLAGISGVDKREALLNVIDDIRHESFDPYATIRSAYIQKRNADIKN